jgi:Mor family transcriptional regulator
MRYPEHIQPQYKEFISKIGIDGVLALSEEFGGGNLYILTKKKLFRGCIARAIKDEYNGNNIKILAKKYDYTTNSILNILKGDEEQYD